MKPNTVARSLQDQSPAYKFNCNTQQNKMNENQFGCVPEDKSQVKLTGRVNRKDIMKKAVKKENWWKMRFSSALVKPGASGNL